MLERLPKNERERRKTHSRGIIVSPGGVVQLFYEMRLLMIYSDIFSENTQSSGVYSGFLWEKSVYRIK